MPDKFTVTLTLPDGRRKYFRGDTKKEAEKKRDAARKELEAGIDIGSKMTVKELCELWLRDYKKGQIRQTSYTGLEYTVNAHIVAGLGDMRVIKVKPAHIRAMINERRNLARSTQTNIIRATRAIFAVAVENDIIAKNPVVPSIKATGDAPDEVEALTDDESRRLLAAAEGTDIYMFVLLALKAGLRRGELLALRWNDIDLDNGVLNVRHNLVYDKGNKGFSLSDDLKTKAGYRKIPLPTGVVSELLSARREASSVLVVPGKSGRAMHPSTLRYKWMALCAEANVECHPHQLRHTCITNWFRAGLDIKEVQYLAGHSTPAMTMNVYTHYVEEDQFEDTAKKIQAAEG